MAQTTTAEGVGIGWKPELVSPKDYLFADRSTGKMRTVEQLPRKVDLFDVSGPVRNQMAEGSCVGHGWAAAADQITRQDGDRFTTAYSPRFAYNMARVVEGGDAIKHDNGAYVRDGGMALRNHGVCPESAWRYKEGDFAKAPTESRKSKAARFKLEIQRCQSVDEVLAALAAGHPIVAGFVCHSGMRTRDVDRTALLPMPMTRDRIDGGHCTKWGGYDLDLPVGFGFTGAIAFQNSWSAAWGAANGHLGWGWMPIEFIRRGLADDIWAAVKEAT